MVEEDSWTCYCTVADEPNPPKTVIIFKYRPHDWLDAELQAERGWPMEDDTDGIDEVYPDTTSQIDQNATSLTRRRVRADNSTSERNVRVSCV